MNVILNKVAKEDLFEEVTFENRFESSEAMSHVNLCWVWGGEVDDAPGLMTGSSKARQSIWLSIWQVYKASMKGIEWASGRDVRTEREIIFDQIM